MASQFEHRHGEGRDFNPASRYRAPADLARDGSLSSYERLELLDEWEEDVQARLDATSEGMPPHGRTSIDLALISEIEAARRSVAGQPVNASRRIPGGEENVDPIDARQGSRSELSYRVLVNSLIAACALAIVAAAAWWIMSTI